jgi:hypothetical protein
MREGSRDGCFVCCYYWLGDIFSQSLYFTYCIFVFDMLFDRNSRVRVGVF